MSEIPRPPRRPESEVVAGCLATLHRLRPDLVPCLVGRTRVLGWLPGQPWARGLPLVLPARLVANLEQRRRHGRPAHEWAALPNLQRMAAG